jgi:hypothetical protein
MATTTLATWALSVAKVPNFGGNTQKEPKNNLWDRENVWAEFLAKFTKRIEKGPNFVVVVFLKFSYISYKINS